MIVSSFHPSEGGVVKSVATGRNDLLWHAMVPFGGLSLGLKVILCVTSMSWNGCVSGLGGCHCQRWTLVWSKLPPPPTSPDANLFFPSKEWTEHYGDLSVAAALLLISLKCSLWYISGLFQEALSPYNVSKSVWLRVLPLSNSVFKMNIRDLHFCKTTCSITELYIQNQDFWRLPILPDGNLAFYTFTCTNKQV